MSELSARSSETIRAALAAAPRVAFGFWPRGCKPVAAEQVIGPEISSTDIEIWVDAHGGQIWCRRATSSGIRGGKRRREQLVKVYIVPDQALS